MELAPYFRVYELPWSPTEEIERRFRNVLRGSLLVFALIALIVPFLPTPEKPDIEFRELEERYAKVVIARQPPPPPPPPPQEEIKPEPVPDVPKPEQPKPTAQDQAKKAMLKLQDELADLRDMQIPQGNPDRELIGAVAENARSERNLITSGVGRGSGGINTSGLSAGFGSGSGPLGDINTTQVVSRVGKEAAADKVKRGQGNKGASRSEEEIVRVFDANKGAIYAIYTRALRDKPDLKGKLVLELTISPEGEITACKVISSELGDEELERKLVARVKLFRFQARDVGTITVTKPIDFFPA